MKHWPEKDLEFLRTAAGKGEMTVQQAAAQLGRSESAVYSKLREMNLSLVRSREWTPERDEILRRKVEAGKSLRDMCRSLNVTRKSLDDRLALLGLEVNHRVVEARPKPAHCPTCFIVESAMAGCPRPECAHYEKPLEPGPVTLAGVGTRMLVA